MTAMKNGEGVKKKKLLKIYVESPLSKESRLHTKPPTIHPTSTAAPGALGLESAQAPPWPCAQPLLPEALGSVLGWKLQIGRAHV